MFKQLQAIAPWQIASEMDNNHFNTQSFASGIFYQPITHMFLSRGDRWKSLSEL